MYTHLHQLLGLPPAAPRAKLSFEIVPRPLATAGRTTGQRMLVPSPILLPIPVDASQETVLKQVLSNALLREGVDEVLRQTPVREPWQSMVEGVQRWLHRHDLVPFYQRINLPDELSAPWRQNTLPKPVALSFLLRAGWSEESEPQLRIVCAQSVIEYSVAAYGLESLPALLRAIGQHDDWTTLVPAVFGVSAPASSVVGTRICRRKRERCLGTQIGIGHS